MLPVDLCCPACWAISFALGLPEDIAGLPGSLESGVVTALFATSLSYRGLTGAGAGACAGAGVAAALYMATAMSYGMRYSAHLRKNPLE